MLRGSAVHIMYSANSLHTQAIWENEFADCLITINIIINSLVIWSVTLSLHNKLLGICMQLNVNVYL